MNKKWLLWSSIVFVGIALLVFMWWIFWGRFTKWTADSYVQGNQVRLTSQIEGYVASIYAEDTELVEEGKVLIELDPTDRILAFEKAKNELALKVREVTKLFETAYMMASECEKAQAKLIETEVLYNNRKEVVESGAVSEEEFIVSEINYCAAQSALMSAQYNLMKAVSEVQNTTIATHPLVEKAKMQLREAYVNLQRCILKSPATGIVSQRNAQVGQSINPSNTLMSVIPLNQMWVDANFKEVDLSKIRIGQKAKLVSDMYGRKVVYTGYVVGIGIASGAVLSPLPPQNATGNWIKIVQRIPVRVSLNPEELKQNPLRLGLSMSVSIDVRDMEGKRIPDKAANQLLYQTDIFKSQLDGAEAVIKEILNENETFDMSMVWTN